MRRLVVAAIVALLPACDREEPKAAPAKSEPSAAAEPASAPEKPSNIKSDEVVRFLPTFARLRDGTWTLPVEPWVYEPEDDGLVRRAALKVVEETAELKLDDTITARLVANMGPFVVDNEGGKHVVVRWGEQAAEACETEGNGRCSGTLSLAAENAERIARRTSGGVPVVDLRVVLRDGDRRVFETPVYLLDDTGVSVISDIDDTIKVTACHDKAELLRNTLLREPTAAAGVAAVYARWADAGAAFHYVSNSPLPLLGALTTFIHEAGYPEGSLALKPFRWKDGSFLELLAPPEDHKQAVLEAMVEPWTKRRFVLVGDTGERDPEIYAALARKFPARVAKIYLRDPQAGTPGLDARMQATFEGLPRTLWQVFSDGNEITDPLPKP